MSSLAPSLPTSTRTALAGTAAVALALAALTGCSSSSGSTGSSSPTTAAAKALDVELGKKALLTAAEFGGTGWTSSPTPVTTMPTPTPAASPVGTEAQVACQQAMSGMDTIDAAAKVYVRQNYAKAPLDANLVLEGYEGDVPDFAGALKKVNETCKSVTTMGPTTVSFALVDYPKSKISAIRISLDAGGKKVIREYAPAVIDKSAVLGSFTYVEGALVPDDVMAAQVEKLKKTLAG